MSKNKATILIVLSLIVLVVAGYFAFKTYKSQPTDKTANTVKNSGTSQQGNTAGREDAVKSPEVDLIKLMSQSPGPSATQDDYKKFTASVSAYAVTSNVLDVTGCKVNPKVLKLDPKNQTVKLRNDDKVKHRIFNSQGLNLEAAADSLSSVQIGLKQQGIYGYLCDPKDETGRGPIAGVLVVLP